MTSSSCLHSAYHHLLALVLWWFCWSLHNFLKNWKFYACFYCLQPLKENRTFSWLRVSVRIRVPSLGWVTAPSGYTVLLRSTPSWSPDAGGPTWMTLIKSGKGDSSPKEKWEGKNKVRGKRCFAGQTTDSHMSYQHSDGVMRMNLETLKIPWTLLEPSLALVLELKDLRLYQPGNTMSIIYLLSNYVLSATQELGTWDTVASKRCTVWWETGLGNESNN